MKGFELLCYRIFPLIGAYIIRRNVLSEVSRLENQEKSTFYNDRVSLDNIQKIFNKESERKKVVEDKAKTNVTTVTYAVTLISILMVSINGAKTSVIFSQISPFEKSLLFIFFILTFLYLLMSGVSALLALELNKFFDISIQNELYLSARPEQDRISMLIESIELNNCFIAIRESFVMSSYKNIFNGLVCMVVLLAFATYTYFSAPEQKVTEIFIKSQTGQDRAVKIGN